MPNIQTYIHTHMYVCMCVCISSVCECETVCVTKKRKRVKGWINMAEARGRKECGQTQDTGHGP